MRIKAEPEAFVVDEIPAYDPSGEGDHIMLSVRKRALTTLDAANAIARALELPRGEVGFAGMKDRVAVTSQRMSVPARGFDPARLSAIESDDLRIEVLGAHPNKLRTGHLRGNAFRIRIDDLDAGAAERARPGFARLAAEGIANHFGPQRFGHDGKNAEHARAWLAGRARAPKNPRIRRLHFSALQAEIFNRVLDRRIEDGSWRRALRGDLLKRHDSGALFVSSDPEVDTARIEAGEISPTGPMVGVKMREPEADALELERAIIAEGLGEGVSLDGTRKLGLGTRRGLRVWLQNVSVGDAEPGGAEKGEAGGNERWRIWVEFVLPKGAYATTVARAVFGDELQGRDESLESEDS